MIEFQTINGNDKKFAVTRTGDGGIVSTRLYPKQYKVEIYHNRLLIKHAENEAVLLGNLDYTDIEIDNIAPTSLLQAKNLLTPLVYHSGSESGETTDQSVHLTENTIFGQIGQTQKAFNHGISTAVGRIQNEVNNLPSGDVSQELEDKTNNNAYNRVVIANNASHEGYSSIDGLLLKLPEIDPLSEIVIQKLRGSGVNVIGRVKTLNSFPISNLYTEHVERVNSSLLPVISLLFSPAVKFTNNIDSLQFLGNGTITSTSSITMVGAAYINAFIENAVKENNAVIHITAANYAYPTRTSGSTATISSSLAFRNLIVSYGGVGNAYNTFFPDDLHNFYYTAKVGATITYITVDFKDAGNVILLTVTANKSAKGVDFFSARKLELKDFRLYRYATVKYYNASATLIGTDEFTFATLTETNAEITA